jgi:hypothetical protein
MDKRITLRHLEAFRSIMVRRPVTGAAEMLEVTQPALARLIADLDGCESIAADAKTAGTWEQCATKCAFIQD